MKPRRRITDVFYSATFAFIFFICICEVCFAQPFQYVWDASRIAASSSGYIRLLGGKEKALVGTVAVNQVRDLIEVKERLCRSIGLDADLVLTDGADPNAFATNVNGKNVIGVNLAMMQRFGSDKDVLAVVMGHEVGHLVHRHLDQERQREAVLGVIGLIAGIALDTKLNRKYGPTGGLGYNVAQIGTTLVSRKFDRDQEREADDYGIEKAHAAGYNASAAVRFWRAMGYGGNGLFLSTHPSNSERIENIERQVAALTPRAPLTVATVPSTSPTASTVTNAKSAFVLPEEFRESESQADDPFIVAVNAYRESKYDEAFKFASTSAENGDARGQFMLGYLHFTGNGTAKDYGSAQLQFQSAADQGSATAETFLGIMCEIGAGIPRDYAEAVRHYETAAAANFPHGMARLAAMKYFGRGVQKDVDGALAVAKEAILRSPEPIAFHLLGIASFSGNGLPKDYSEARRYLEQAAAKSFGPSQAILGVMYDNAFGVAKDPARAVQYFRSAASKNIVDGKIGLAYHYISGAGIAPNFQEAKRLFEEAYRQGNVFAMVGLARIYKDGLGVPRDLPRAYAYLELSVQKGNKGAARARDQVGSQLTDTDRAASQAIIADLMR